MWFIKKTFFMISKPLKYMFIALFMYACYYLVCMVVPSTLVYIELNLYICGVKTLYFGFILEAGLL